MTEQMKMNGPWFVITVPEADLSLPIGSMQPSAVVFEARDQADAVKIGGFQSLNPNHTVYIAQALVKVQPQFAITNLVEPVPTPDLEADDALADSISDEIEELVQDEERDAHLDGHDDTVYGKGE